MTCVFTPFPAFCTQEAPMLDDLRAAVCIMGAVCFIFRA